MSFPYSILHIYCKGEQKCSYGGLCCLVNVGFPIGVDYFSAKQLWHMIIL